jgi:ribosomal protein L11 methyltransferase
MKWFELSARTDAEGAEAAAAVLNEFTPGGAVIEQIVLPDPGELFDPARAFTVRAFFNDTQRDALARAETAVWHLSQLRPMTPETREIREEDWAEAWKKYYTILRIGKRMVIKPSWLEYSAVGDDVVVELDPGMAFGTGLHPTTRMCLQAVEERVRRGMKILDVGTGSGILAIAAALLMLDRHAPLEQGERKYALDSAVQTQRIFALDTDPVAVETAIKNAEINGVEAVVRVEQGSIDPERDARMYDVVCANLLAEIVTDLAPAMAASLRKGGIVIASGILDFKADWVADALVHAGLTMVEKKTEEDWVSLIAQRNS